MIFAAVIALVSAQSSPTTLTLEQWEGCAKSTVSTCDVPGGTDEWKSCLEVTDPMRMEEWDMCEFVSFPDCFQDSLPDDVQSSLRLCGAQRAVAARNIAMGWASEQSAWGNEAGAAQMRFTWARVEQLAMADASVDPLMASGARVGAMVSGLKAMAFIRNASNQVSPARRANSTRS